MQQGGGIGHDFSTLRPKGAPVKGVGADASGPVCFMDVWDSMCRTIMSAGARRGAMMATLRCDHPDIEAFIDAKRDPARLRMFNLSVLVTDAFMGAVRKDDGLGPRVRRQGLPHRSGPRAVGPHHARDLRLRRAGRDLHRPHQRRQQPRLLRDDPARPIRACTADTWVHTAARARGRSRELVGVPFAARVDGEDHASGARLLSPPAEAGSPAADDRGPRAAPDGRPSRQARRAADARANIETEWCAAGELRAGDPIVLHDHRAKPAWPGALSASEGYLLGLLVGDGTLKADKAVLCVWPPRGGRQRHRRAPGVDGVMDEALRARADAAASGGLSGWMEVAGRNEYRLGRSAH